MYSIFYYLWSFCIQNFIG